MLTLAGQRRCQKKKKKKKRGKRNENKVYNISVPEPQKIPAMIIWDGVKLSVKKQTHAAVKDRVCTDSAFIYIYIYIKRYCDT